MARYVTVYSYAVNSNLYCVMIRSAYLISWQSQGLPGIRVCLKNAFCKIYVTICGRFCLNEGGVAGYVNRMKTKYTAKWGM